MTKFLALFFSATAAFAQVDNTITVTATRQITLQPDEIVFFVSVQTPDSAGIEDALAKVSGTGITAENLTGVFTDSQDVIDWDFTLAAPLAQGGPTIALLAQLQQSSGGAVFFRVQGTQVSQAAQQSQPCSQTALIADAQKQAQTLAAAAGFTVGPVLAVSDGSRMAAPASVITLVGTNFISNAIVEPIAPTNTCTAVVKFQFYSYH